MLWFIAPPPPPRSARSAFASAAMCRRPLLPLLALAALLALPPASHGLSCFQCLSNSLSSYSASNPLLNSLSTSVSAGSIDCADFDTTNSAMKLRCGSDQRSCAKINYNGNTVLRGCSKTSTTTDKCTEGTGTSGEGTTCLCTRDFCNSAGLTAPALLLLLPAALLAALYSRQ